MKRARRAPVVQDPARIEYLEKFVQVTGEYYREKQKLQQDLAQCVSIQLVLANRVNQLEQELQKYHKECADAQTETDPVCTEPVETQKKCVRVI